MRLVAGQFDGRIPAGDSVRDSDRRARGGTAAAPDIGTVWNSVSEDLLAADSAARARGLDLIGIYHSHPDCDAYFSKTDLENSCPWYSFVVLSIHNGEFHHANSWLPNFDQTEAAKEELIY